MCGWMDGEILCVTKCHMPHIFAQVKQLYNVYIE